MNRKFVFAKCYRDVIWGLLCLMILKIKMRYVEEQKRRGKSHFSRFLCSQTSSFSNLIAVHLAHFFSVLLTPRP